MKRSVIVFAVAVLMFCLSVWALGWSRQTTGHLIVTCTDKETGVQAGNLQSDRNPDGHTVVTR